MHMVEKARPGKETAGVKPDYRPPAAAAAITGQQDSEPPPPNYSAFRVFLRLPYCTSPCRYQCDWHYRELRETVDEPRSSYIYVSMYSMIKTSFLHHCHSGSRQQAGKAESKNRNRHDHVARPRFLAYCLGFF